MPNDQHLMDESQVPDNWVSAEVAKATPPAPPARPDMPMFFSGSLPPNIQHDTSFVGTKTGSFRIPTHSLMPLGVQANPASNAGVQSTVIKQINNNVGSNITLQTNGSNNPNQQILDLEPGTSNVSLSTDSSGAVRVSVAAGFFTSRPDYKRWTLWAQNGGTGGISSTGFTAVNDTIVNTNSGVAVYTAVPPSSVDDFGFENKITGTSGNFSGITGTFGIIPARDFSLYCPIRASTMTGNERIWVALSDFGVGSVGGIANSNTPATTNLIGFRFNPTTGANWFAVVANGGGTQTEVDTGIPVSSASANMLRATFTAASNTSTFYIDGVLVATISATAPSASAPLAGLFSVACTGGVSVTNAIRTSAFYTEARTVVTTN